MAGRTQIEGLMAQLEEMWGHLDTLFGAIEREGAWGQRHGPDWTFADVPYHLAYFDRDLIARPIALGANLPESERQLIPTEEELNAWNARKFAERPAGQTPAQSLAEMRASRDAIRQAAASMTDDDLGRPFFMPILGLGWLNAGMGLMFPTVHNWSEFTQARFLMGRKEPAPSALVTNTYLGAMVGFMPMFLDKEAAKGVSLTVVFDFTDPGVAAQTVRIADGAATVTAGKAEDADLVFTESAETWETVFRGHQDPAAAMQSGAMKVSNTEALATFGGLFPM